MKKAICLKIKINKNLSNHPENIIASKLIPKLFGTWWNWCLCFIGLISGITFIIIGIFISMNLYDRYNYRNYYFSEILSICLMLSHLPITQAVIEVQKIKLYYYSLNYYDTVEKQISQLNIFKNLNSGVGYLYLIIILLQAISTCVTPILLSGLIGAIEDSGIYHEAVVGFSIAGGLIIQNDTSDIGFAAGPISFFRLSSYANFGAIVGPVISMVLGIYIEEIILIIAWNKVIDNGYELILSQGWFCGIPELIKSL